MRLTLLYVNLEKELKDHQKGTHGLVFDVKKPHKNNAVRFAPVLAVGTR